MALPIYQIIFFVFAAVLIASAVMVIVAKNPVHALLFLVLSFFCSSILWMMIQAEFLALVLIFVYVGAVMTLFLFVVMMLNIDLSNIREQFVRYLPYALVVIVLLVGMMLLVIRPGHIKMAMTLPVHHAASYSNTKAMGALLYTRYLYEFEIAAAILLVAIVSAIALAFTGRRKGTKSQNIAAQHKASKQDRLRLVDIKKGKSS